MAIHAPWDEIAVRPSDFYHSVRISTSLPWLKVALPAAQYLCPKDGIAEGPSNNGYGNLLTTRDFERIAKASRGQTQTDSLGRVESFLSYLANAYLKASGIGSEKLTLEIPSAFARTVRAVLLTKDLEGDTIELTKVESKLREHLQSMVLPPPFHEGHQSA